MADMATQLKSVDPTRDPLEDMSLPGWLYYDPEFFEAEKRAFLRAARAGRAQPRSRRAPRPAV